MQSTFRRGKLMAKPKPMAQSARELRAKLELWGEPEIERGGVRI